MKNSAAEKVRLKIACVRVVISISLMSMLKLNLRLTLDSSAMGDRVRDACTDGCLGGTAVRASDF